MKRSPSSCLLLAVLCVACASDDTSESAASSGMSGIGAAGGAGGQAGASAVPVAGTSGGTAAPSTGGVGGFGAGGFGAAGATIGTGGVAGATPAGDAGLVGGDGGGEAEQPDGGGAPPDGYAPCPASGEPCKILPFGDSITFGIGYSGGYRVELFRRALADGKSITFTGSVMNGPSTVEGQPFPRNNEGHSGWKIDQVADLIPSPALEEPPHIVLVMIGTNDVAQNDDLANAPARLGELIDKLATNAPDALIVVTTIIPLSFGGGGVGSYNAALPDVIAERAASGVHVRLVDAFEGFPSSELGDGVHPNQQGYERLAGVFYEAIGEALR